MELLHFDVLLLVFEALRDEPASVETLVGCLPAEVKGSLPEAPSPQDRLLRVLTALNGWQSYPDAELPLRRFLRTAEALFVSQQKAEVFQRVLAMLGELPTTIDDSPDEEPPPPHKEPPPPPEGPTTIDEEGPEQEALPGPTTIDEDEDPEQEALRSGEELSALALKVTLTKYFYRQMGYEVDASGGQPGEVFFAWRGPRACVVGVCVGEVQRTIDLVRDGLRLAREATQTVEGQVVLASPTSSDEARDAILKAGLRGTSLDDLRSRVGRVTRERSLEELQSLVYRQIATFVEAERARHRDLPAGEEPGWIRETRELLSAAPSTWESGRCLVAAYAADLEGIERARVAVAQALANGFPGEGSRAPLHLEVDPAQALELEEWIASTFREQSVRMSVPTAISLLDQDIVLPVIFCPARVDRRSPLWGIVRHALSGATCGVLLFRSKRPVTEAAVAAWAGVPEASVRLLAIEGDAGAVVARTARLAAGNLGSATQDCD